MRDDRRQFEFLILEGAQAGLSWSTILNKRGGYRRAFAGFDPQRVARFNKRSIERLVADAGIVRNRLKIQSAIGNGESVPTGARAVLGSFHEYLWDFVDGEPVQNFCKSQKNMPASTPLSDAVSKDLKQRGFKFVGTTIIYAHLQATGLVNDHIVGCFRHAPCKELSKR